jgi:hypothetical protein
MVFVLAHRGSHSYASLVYIYALLQVLYSHRDRDVRRPKFTFTSVLNLPLPTGCPMFILTLSTIPTHFNGSVLRDEEFQDGIRLQYMKVPSNLSIKCDGCNSNFSVGHAHQCKKGGLVTRRNDEINYELANLMRLAFKKSTVRAKPPTILAQ